MARHNLQHRLAFKSTPRAHLDMTPRAPHGWRSRLGGRKDRRPGPVAEPARCDILHLRSAVMRRLFAVPDHCPDSRQTRAGQGCWGGALTATWGHDRAAAGRRGLRRIPSRRGPTWAKHCAHIGSSDSCPDDRSIAKPSAELWSRTRRRHGSPRTARRTSGTVRGPGRGRRSPPATPGDRAARIRPDIGGLGGAESDPHKGYGGRDACGGATGCRPRQVLEPLRHHRQ
jgi:hypothetical protein